ncbi:hypothetical protein [Rossellomorea marisflavi]|uniref:hypothetical protein n=1 Tax=Rossellomorea marisflavi TaxID=189381 RepID=UPI003516EC81
MRTFPTLKVLDAFKGLFAIFGFDYPVIRKILHMKWTMDGRRVPTIFQQGKVKNEKDGNRFIKSLWVYALYGLLLLPILFFGDMYLFQMTLIFSVIFFMTSTSMISDFSVVILDVRDSTILFTKPVQRKDISMAKALHVFFYLFFLTGALTIIPLVVSFFLNGFVFFLLFLVGIVLLDLLILAMTALMYYYVLKFFDGEKLKDMINYVQIGLSVGIAIAYQLAARAFDLVDVNMSFSPEWWTVLIPPLWFGAPFEYVLNGNHSSVVLIMSILFVLVPLAALVIYIKALPQFERNLHKLSAQAGGRKRRVKSNRFLKVLCRNQEERAFYRFAQKMMRTERDFKLKVYPSLGFALILPFLFIFTRPDLSIWDLHGSKSYLAVYVSLIVAPSVVMMLNYSGRHKGSWIYRVAPVTRVESVYKGTLKAFLVKQFLPVYMVLALACIFLYGPVIIPDLIVIFMIMCIITVICSVWMNQVLPFSESFEGMAQSETLKIIPFFFLAGALAGLHYLVLKIPFGIYGYGLLVAAVNLGCWKWLIKGRNEPERL